MDVPFQPVPLLTLPKTPSEKTADSWGLQASEPGREPAPQNPSTLEGL